MNEVVYAAPSCGSLSLSRAEQSLKARPYLRCAECTAFGLLSKFSKRSLARLFVTCMCLSVCPCVCISVYFVACHEQHHLYRAEIVKIIIIEEKNTTLTHTHTLTQTHSNLIERFYKQNDNSIFEFSKQIIWMEKIYYNNTLIKTSYCTFYNAKHKLKKKQINTQFSETNLR